MKEIFSAKDTLANRISYYHLLAFLVVLPFDRFYSELILISLLMHILIHFPRGKNLHFHLSLFLPALLFLLTVAGSVFTSDRTQAFMDCEKELALLLFPFIFYASSLDFEKYKIRLLKAFGILCALIILFLFFNAWQVIRYNKLPVMVILSPSFTNHNFSLPIDLHATYFSMFISLSLAAFLYLLLLSKKTGERILYTAGCLILLAGLIQLASRSVFLAMLLILNIAIPLFLLQGKTRKKFIFSSACFSALLVGLFTATGSFKSRYLTTLKQDLTIAGVPRNLSESRMKRWYSMWTLIRQRPVTGYGSGTEVALLKKNYYEHQLYNSYLHELNADNQYISLLLKHGVIGLLLYVSVLFMGFSYSIRAKDFLFFSFLVIISVVSFSENILDVNKGIFFFSFFFSYFMKAEVQALAKARSR